MSITRHNCEAFFLDYYEEELSPVEVAELLFFLEENLDLKEAFEGYKTIFLEQEKIHFTLKESLKRRYRKEELDSILNSEITKTNCEHFFIAYTEDILSDEQVQKLNLFIATHPNLEKEFELFKKCKLVADNIKYENKDSLNKAVTNTKNKEEYFIRAIENDLNESEQQQLTSFLAKNPQYKSEFALFEKTILVSEQQLFEHKEYLKKREKKPVFIYFLSAPVLRYGMAASILLLLGLFYFFGNNMSVKEAHYIAEPPTHSKSFKENPPNKQSTLNIPVQAKSETKQREQENIISTGIVNASVPPVQKTKRITVVPHNDILSNLNSNLGKLAIAENDCEKNPEAKLVQEMIAVTITKSQIDSILDRRENISILASTDGESKKQDYQTISSFVNHKLRLVLGISKTTECETSDKIKIWDLAMVAKKGVQNMLGTKRLDINKVCADSGEKIAYIFTAGNFEISKTAPK